MKGAKNIKLMLLGIALLVFSVWCLIYGYLDQLTLVMYLSIILHWVGLGLAIYGFVVSDSKEAHDSGKVSS